jgi:hypothetical protein
MKSKKGYIIVSDVIMWDFDVMKALYSIFYPFHIEYEHWMNRFKIYGCSEFFDEVQEGEAPRQYDFDLIRNDIGQIMVSKCNKSPNN